MIRGSDGDPAKTGHRTGIVSELLSLWAEISPDDLSSGRKSSSVGDGRGRRFLARSCRFHNFRNVPHPL